MLQSALTQLHYVTSFNTCFGFFYKTIFRPSLTAQSYTQCVHTLCDPCVFTQNHNNRENMFKNAKLMMGYKGKGKGRPRTGHEGPEGKQMYSYTLPSTSALDAGGWSAPRPGHFTPGKDPVPIVQEAGWAPGPVWTGAENLAPTGIRSPHRPVRSESLYRLSYRCPIIYIYIINL